jgi:signal transduction histidine kinase
VSYIAFFAAALIVLDVGLFLIMRQILLGGVENELRLGVEAIQRNFDQVNVNPAVFESLDNDQLLVLAKPPPAVGVQTTNLYIQLHQPDRERTVRSPNIDDLPESLRIDNADFQAVLNGESLIRDIDVGGLRMREFLTPLRLGDITAGVLQIARPVGEIERTLTLFLYTLFGGGIVVLLAAARGGVWLTRAAFKPIDEIAHTAESIVRAEDLSRRVPVPDTEDELQRLSITVNELLGRLDELFSQQQRFVADVSHELRTPLAAMRGNLEVLYRGASRDPQLLEESLDDMRREVNRLIRMVNDLLLLAQSDAGIQLRHEPVELDTLLLEVHRELRPLTNGVQLQIGHEDQVIVIGDRDRIKQALLNLGINALQHTAPGGSVVMGLDHADGMARLSVADTGTGIDPHDMPHIFQRFYRADRARNRRVGGAGLGLALVKWIAEAHGGRVTVESVPGQGSTFTILLPLSATVALQFAHDEQVVS